MTARDFSTLADSRTSLATAINTITAKEQVIVGQRREIERLRHELDQAHEWAETLQDRVESLECEVLSAKGI